MMETEPQMRFVVAASGGLRSALPEGAKGGGDWVCLDGHLWMKTPRMAEATAMLPKLDDPKTLVLTEIKLDMATLALRSSGGAVANWAKVPEAQALITGVSQQIDRAVAQAIPVARAALPDAAPSLATSVLSEMNWPIPARGKLGRALGWLRGRVKWPILQPNHSTKRKRNLDRNRALQRLDVAIAGFDALDEVSSLPPPDQRLARFVQRLKGASHPMQTAFALTMAEDHSTVTLQVTQHGRIDLLAGISEFAPTRAGIDVIRLKGRARERAIMAYSVTQLVIFARCFEASWQGRKPKLCLSLTLADPPETRTVMLTVGAQGWGFSLAQLALALPDMPPEMPRGLTVGLHVV